MIKKNKTRHVSIRFTENEIQRMDRAKKKEYAGCLSTWIRQKILQMIDKKFKL